MKFRIKLVAGLPVEQVRMKLHYHNRASDVHCRALAFYLDEVDKRTLYRGFGAPSTVAFADNEL